MLFRWRKCGDRAGRFTHFTGLAGVFLVAMANCMACQRSTAGEGLVAAWEGTDIWSFTCMNSAMPC